MCVCFHRGAGTTGSWSGLGAWGWGHPGLPLCLFSRSRRGPQAPSKHMLLPDVRCQPVVVAISRLAVKQAKGGKGKETACGMWCGVLALALAHCET
jgi:hypothetical protein